MFNTRCIVLKSLIQKIVGEITEKVPNVVGIAERFFFYDYFLISFYMRVVLAT
jgi:hypothetical protein